MRSASSYHRTQCADSGLPWRRPCPTPGGQPGPSFFFSTPLPSTSSFVALRHLIIVFLRRFFSNLWLLFHFPIHLIMPTSILIVGLDNGMIKRSDVIDVIAECDRDSIGSRRASLQRRWIHEIKFKQVFCCFPVLVAICRSVDAESVFLQGWTNRQRACEEFSHVLLAREKVAGQVGFSVCVFHKQVILEPKVKVEGEVKGLETTPCQNHNADSAQHLLQVTRNEVWVTL